MYLAILGFRGMPVSSIGLSALPVRIYSCRLQARHSYTVSPPKVFMSLFVVRNALVVDANQDLKDLLLTVLKPGIWAIRYVSTNAAALTAAKSKAFELVITGEKTSAKQDVELLQKIRAERPHTRMIILAEESTPGDVLAAMRDHAFSYFSKPYSPEQLAQMVQMATEVPAWDDGIELISATPEWILLEVRCQIRTADRLLQFMKEITNLPEDERGSVGTAFREILLNAIEHGGGLDPHSYVEVEYVRARRMVSCRIRDPGPGFTLDEITHAAVANPPDDPIRHAKVRDELGLRPGGFGILLAQRLVDQVLYNEDGNEVLLIKYLDQPQAKTA
jgi:anti-sigma regulatory factor (Ser/Thr protein kinase)/CheY-like chemotaxis protein